MMNPLAVFGINSDGLNLAVKLLILLLVFVYLALVYYTYTDARRRIADPIVIGCATAASLFPFVGTIIYAIVRPPEFLDDVRLRELEMQAAEARLVTLDYELCPHCEYEVKPDYLRCPSCMRKLRERCHSCGKAVDPAWRLCPYCEAETSATPPASSSRRRRRGATTSEDVVAEAPPRSSPSR
jgi:RNA polymerase subunit RPABC4/transcription elongation factor Spt4